MAFSPDFRTTTGSVTQSAVFDAGLRGYMLRVYNWMASGLLLTGIVSYAIAHSAAIDLFYPVMQTQFGLQRHASGLGMISMVLPLAFVLVLSFGVNRLSRTAAQALYWVFCGAMGLSLANIFLVYTGESVARTFFISAGTFAAMSAWGYTTKTDLTKFGNFLFMGLIGVMLASMVNIFLHSSGLQFVISIAGVLVFTGLTAFDTQRIKANYLQFAYADGPDATAKRSVYDALQLFLNFINLFMLLLQLTGSRRSN